MFSLAKLSNKNNCIDFITRNGTAVTQIRNTKILTLANKEDNQTLIVYPIRMMTYKVALLGKSRLSCLKSVTVFLCVLLL